MRGGQSDELGGLVVLIFILYVMFVVVKAMIFGV
jgi:hypothetical protein